MVDFKYTVHVFLFHKQVIQIIFYNYFFSNVEDLRVVHASLLYKVVIYRFHVIFFIFLHDYGHRILTLQHGNTAEPSMSVK